MRIITAFQGQPQYVLGQDPNIPILKKKLIKDKTILSEIKRDYDQCPEKYESEYIKAKTMHLRNNYYCCWLVLKELFEQAKQFELQLSPRTQREELEKLGWMMPQQFINSCFSTLDVSTAPTEQLFVRILIKSFDRLFDFSIGEPQSRIDRYYKQAICNFKEGRYYSCAVSLFPIIESLHRAITAFNKDSFYRIKEHLEEVEKRIQTIQPISNFNIEYYVNMVKQFNDLAENHYFISLLPRQLTNC